MGSRPGQASLITWDSFALFALRYAFFFFFVLLANSLFSNFFLIFKILVKYI